MSNVSVLSQLSVKGPLVVDVDAIEYPANPKLGTLIVKDGALVVFTTVDGLQSWYPLTRPNSTYVHVQALAALEWTVSHGLTSGDVWYQIQDVDGNPVLAGGFTKIDNDSFTLTFSEAQAGKVLVVATSALDVPVVRTSLMQIGEADDVVLAPSGITVGGATGVAIGPTGITLNGVAIGDFDDTDLQNAITGLNNRVTPLEAQVADLLDGTTVIDKGTVNTGTVTFNLGGKPQSAQRLQVGGPLTIATSGWPAAGVWSELVLHLVNGAAFALTWPAIRWIKADGSYTTTFSANEITLQTAGSDFILLWSFDGGVTVYGKVVR